MYVERNTEARSRNQRGRGKAKSIAYSVCVFVALGIQHAKRMRRIVLSYAAYPALTFFFSTLCYMI